MAKKSVLTGVKKLVNADPEGFFNKYSKMVNTYAAYAAKRGVKESYEDLVQEGYLVLCEAAVEFNESHKSGASFKTFLHPKLRTHFMKWDNSPDLSLDDPNEVKSRKMKNDSGITGLSLVEILPSKAPTPYEAAVKKEMWEYVTSLPVKLRKVLLMRYMKGMTLEETGEKLHLTRERVRQIEAAAIKQLQNNFITEVAA